MEKNNNFSETYGTALSLGVTRMMLEFEKNHEADDVVIKTNDGGEIRAWLSFGDWNNFDDNSDKIELSYWFKNDKVDIFSGCCSDHEFCYDEDEFEGEIEIMKKLYKEHLEGIIGEVKDDGKIEYYIGKASAATENFLNKMNKIYNNN